MKLCCRRFIKSWQSNIQVWLGLACVRANAEHWTRILLGAVLDKAEQFKASMRAKVEHPFRVIKCQFGLTRARYKGLAKNTVQLMALFALGNSWMAHRKLIRVRG
jgi:IS5 family transposase